MPHLHPLHRRTRRGPRLAAVVLAVLALAASAGCVERRLMIRSNPPGATVYVDDYDTPIGTTPIAVNFTYYGTRKIRLVKDGYETLTVMQPVPAPWYEIPGVDFFPENVLPGKLRDVQEYTYQLMPTVMVPPDQLRVRGEELRRSSAAAAAADAAAARAAAQAAAVRTGPAPVVQPQPVRVYGPQPPIGPATPEPIPPGAVSPFPATVPPPGWQVPPGTPTPTPSNAPPPGWQVPPAAPPSGPAIVPPPTGMQLPDTTGVGGYPVHPLPPDNMPR